MLSGASSSNRIGCWRNISRDFRHKPLTSCSDIWTALPGRHRFTGNIARTDKNNMIRWGVWNVTKKWIGWRFVKWNEPEWMKEIFIVQNKFWRSLMKLFELWTKLAFYWQWNELHNLKTVTIWLDIIYERTNGHNRLILSVYKLILFWSNYKYTGNEQVHTNVISTWIWRKSKALVSIKFPLFLYDLESLKLAISIWNWS